jgi:hypothetical protein
MERAGDQDRRGAPIAEVRHEFEEAIKRERLDRAD